jgi:hypothetical protein
MEDDEDGSNRVIDVDMVEENNVNADDEDEETHELQDDDDDGEDDEELLENVFQNIGGGKERVTLKDLMDWDFVNVLIDEVSFHLSALSFESQRIAMQGFVNQGRFERKNDGVRCNKERN